MIPVKGEPSITGEADGTIWTVAAARYAKDQAAVRHKSDNKLKSRGDRIADALGGRYSHRERAYIMSRNQGRAVGQTAPHRVGRALLQRRRSSART